MVELITLLEVNGDYLVDSNELLRDGFLEVGEGVGHAVLMCGLHVVHGLEDVQNLLLANTETLVCVDLTCRILVLNGDIQAPLVEV